MTNTAARYQKRQSYSITLTDPIPDAIWARLGRLAEGCMEELVEKGELVRVEVGGEVLILTPEEALEECEEAAAR